MPFRPRGTQLRPPVVVLSLATAACVSTTPPDGSLGTPAAAPSEATSAPSFAVEPRNPVDPAVARRVYEQGRGLFAYDASKPLDMRQPAEPIRETDFAVIHDITYASPKAGRVTALLIVPKADEPVPAVIIQHGMIGSRWGPAAPRRAAGAARRGLDPDRCAARASA